MQDVRLDRNQCSSVQQTLMSNVQVRHRHHRFVDGFVADVLDNECLSPSNLRGASMEPDKHFCFHSIVDCYCVPANVSRMYVNPKSKVAQSAEVHFVQSRLNVLTTTWTGGWGEDVKQLWHLVMRSSMLWPVLPPLCR